MLCENCHKRKALYTLRSVYNDIGNNKTFLFWRRIEGKISSDDKYLCRKCLKVRVIIYVLKGFIWLKDSEDMKVLKTS